MKRQINKLPLLMALAIFLFLLAGCHGTRVVYYGIMQYTEVSSSGSEHVFRSEGGNMIKYQYDEVKHKYLIQIDADIITATLEAGTIKVKLNEGKTVTGTVLEGQTVASDVSNASSQDDEILQLVFDIDKFENSSQYSKKSGNPFIAFLLLCGGLLNTIKPRAAWQLNYGWKFKNAEPSGFSLGVIRITGIILLVISIGMFIV